MRDDACLYALLEAPFEHHELIVQELVNPLAQRWRENPELDSLFFVRYSEPVWQVRFRILAGAEWIEREARPLLAQTLESAPLESAIRHVGFATYDREFDRYGGPVGMALAERLFHLDTMACLDWLALERGGETRWTRREFVLLLVERYADAMGFDAEGRLEFDRQGFQWAFDQGVWDEAHRARLDETFERNRRGLEALLGSDPPVSGSPAEQALVAEFVRALAPVASELVAGLEAGTIQAHRPYLAWSLSHMFTNRMGIQPPAEAILRYMAYRRHRDAVAPTPLP
ncbi:MAG: thiopeptide-type bacteriocin biosynthesis protein [Candidatus Eisenbacteria bacterium]